MSGSPEQRFSRGAATLAVGIGATGIATYSYFALASHALDAEMYGRLTVLWSVVFFVVSVLYRPVEQMLSRSIAKRDARGGKGNHHFRVAAGIQVFLAAAFAVAAIVGREPLLNGLFGGSTVHYWVLVTAVLTYAASYFARGYLAGRGRFGQYGMLVLLEAASRLLFALAVAVGIAEGASFVALGIAAAPIISLAVVPFSLRRSLRTGVRAPGSGGPIEAVGSGTGEVLTLSGGAGFAGAVVLIMVAEQALLNAGPLLVRVTEGPSGFALAGLAFNVLLIARAPLQLFQAVQTSILPHLTRLVAVSDPLAFRRIVGITLRGVAGFAASVAIGVLLVGPQLLGLVFGQDHMYDARGLAVVAIGMGTYLAAATLNQAALARSLTRQAAACWLLAASAFVVMLLLPIFDDAIFQVEVAYAAAGLLLLLLLYSLHRRPMQGEPGWDDQSGG